MNRSTKETIVLVLVFILLWKTGILEAGFEPILLFATLTCATIWILEKLIFKKQRSKVIADFKQSYENELKSKKENISFNNEFGNEFKNTNSEKIYQVNLKKLEEQPRWIDWTAGLAPALVFIFLFRSFIYEPYQIPSGSMMPTMVEGDKILVNKHQYGLRLPVFETQLTKGNSVERGDIVVFKYPMQKTIKYIKRVVGLPGDMIVYKNKQLFINGLLVKSKEVDNYTYPDYLGNKVTKQYKEFLGDFEHNILIEQNTPGTINNILNKEILKSCVYDIESVTCQVPQGQYYVMGDNRDASSDSRYWGFVPQEYLVGKAFYIWANFNDMSRVGSIK